MNNLEIAKIFYEIAGILDMQGVQWKPQAYRKAAGALEALSKDVKEIYEKEGQKGLEEIPGIGEGLAKKIIQYIETANEIIKQDLLVKTYYLPREEAMKIPGVVKLAGA
ncbi:DNA polymerase/3'-5' exonuclease PolX, partial [Candidatus Woesearchaeota archaeon]|nr:DNA polymerase/3'-5' exonuclease PolX [Candidatus Woesearchaeota archaeon]